MKWKALTAAAALGACASGAVSADATRQHAPLHDPTARLYFSVGFDMTAGAERPLHYGLRLDAHNQRNWFERPAFAQIDFDRIGLKAATMSNIPLLQRDHALYANGGEVAYNWADFGILAIGAAGLGYIVYELADSESGSDPVPDENGGDGDGDNGDGDDGGGLLGGLLLGGGLVGDPFAGGALSERDYRKWRDGGTGQMGDLE